MECIDLDEFVELIKDERHSNLLDGMPPKSENKVANQIKDAATPRPSPLRDGLRQIDERFDRRCNDKKYSAFTLTFRECLRLNWKERELMTLIHNYLKSWKYHYEPKLEWSLMPDVDTNGNFHYHGVIKIRQASIPKFKRNITQRIGFMKIKYIDNPQRWYNYCYKIGEYKADNVYTKEQSLCLNIENED